MASALQPVGFFSPEYYTPFYFPSLKGLALPGEIPTARYFAPCFFSPYYFVPLLPPGPEPPEVQDSPIRDYNCLAALWSALGATGEFAGVCFGIAADSRPGGTDLCPLAVITPLNWSETDETDPALIVRRLSFSIALSLRDDDAGSGFNRLDRLACVAQNAVAGINVGGGALPVLTRLNRASYDPTTVYPEMRIILQGEFTYLVPSQDGHNTVS